MGAGPGGTSDSVGAARGTGRPEVWSGPGMPRLRLGILKEVPGWTGIASGRNWPAASAQTPQSRLKIGATSIADRMVGHSMDGMTFVRLGLWVQGGLGSMRLEVD